MLDYKSDKHRQYVALVLRRLANRIEKDPELARFLFGDREAMQPVTLHQDQPQPKAKNKNTVDVDVFSMLQTTGVDGFAVQLDRYDLASLRSIISAYGLDPSQKVRRWKTKEKVIAFIVEAVRKRMAQGSAFTREN